MKKTKKSFEELAAQMTALQENQAGKLRGGFSSFGTQPMKSRVRSDDNLVDTCGLGSNDAIVCAGA